MASLTVTEDTTATFRELRKATQRTITRAAANAAGRVQVKAVKSRVPRRSRLLWASITSVTRTRDGHRVAVVIGQSKQLRGFGERARKVKERGIGGGLSRTGELVRLHLVDQPTRAHEIAGPVRTPAGVFSRVQHPGHPGRHFLLDGAVSSESAAVDAFAVKLAARTELAAARMQQTRAED